MLKRKFRFRRRNSLRLVYSKGRTVRVGYLNLKYIKNTKSEFSRLAVVVSKKQSKKAVTRNRIRRRIYETVRLQWSMINPGYDMIITVFDDRAALVPEKDLRNMTVKLFQQSEVYLLNKDLQK